MICSREDEYRTRPLARQSTLINTDCIIFVARSLGSGIYNLSDGRLSVLLTENKSDNHNYSPV